MPKKKPSTTASAQKAPSPALIKFLIANTQAILAGGLEGTAVEEDSGTYKFASCGVPYASFRIDGPEMVLRLRKPRPDPAFDVHMKFWREDGGWLELRTPTDRDPRRWIEAGVGFMAGRLIRESGGAGGLKT